LEEETKKERRKTEDIIEELRNLKMLSGEEDQFSAIIEINLVVGGTESQDWAHALPNVPDAMRSKKGYKVTQIDRVGDESGINLLRCKLRRNGVRFLKSGVHRLVRISPFDSNARRHTSFTGLRFHPLVDNTIEIDVNPGDIEYTSCSGWCWWTKRQQG
jgi:peptide chain release factor 2